MNPCGQCKKPVANEGDYLCAECVGRLLARVACDRDLAVKTGYAMRQQPS